MGGYQQDEQAAPWEMKVRQESIQALKDITGAQVEGRLTRESTEQTLWLDRRLQDTRRGGPDGDDPATFGAAHGVQAIGRRDRQLSPFRMQDVVLDPIGFDWPEGPEADVKRDINDVDRTFLEALKHLLGEVQPGRRRRATAPGLRA